MVSSRAATVDDHLAEIDLDAIGEVVAAVTPDDPISMYESSRRRQRNSAS
jgi:hypothetical protein